MIKFVYRGNDRLFILDGATLHSLHHWVDKAPDSDATRGELTAYFSDIKTLIRHEADGTFSALPGIYLSNASLAVLRGDVYTAFLDVSEYNYGEKYGGYIFNHVFAEYDYYAQNLLSNEHGVHVLFGSHDRAGIDSHHYHGLMPAFLNYNGNIIFVGAADVRQRGAVRSSGEEAVIIYGPQSGLLQYVYGVFNPELNNGSGLTSIYRSSLLVPVPQWMKNEYNNAIAYDNNLRDFWTYNFNMTDCIEYQNKIVACNSCDLIVVHGSGENDIELVYSSNKDVYSPNPKWLAKHNGNLYMLEASGVISRIIVGDWKRGERSHKQNLTNFNWLGDLIYGGIHARAYGFERATKGDIVSYNDKIHVFLGGPSGVYHAYSEDLSVWYDVTDSLPSIMKTRQGHVYTYVDTYKNDLYVLFYTACRGGVLGNLTMGAETANVAYLFKYDSNNNWTQIAWHLIPSFGGAGGFTAYNGIGPNVYMPSGTYYNEPTAELTPIVYKCLDYALLEYKLMDRYSRHFDVVIQYSLDDGCTWQDCSRKRDYFTLQYLGEGTTYLSSSPSGEWHNFYWDFVRDVGYNVNYKYCKLRVVPLLSDPQ
ncbi:MAG: hypothetical protein DRP85_00830 [Candidatus Makaraimicrobium thalassicum]|nr:MAG: hypothetical protein DRP85_00830 [Candidatus Omnitrophota bacterium]